MLRWPSQRIRLALGDPGTLLGRAARALGWSFFNTALARLGTVGIGIFLARLLGPHVFGTFAVAYVAMIALLSINDLGVSAAIVRWPGEPGEIAPTVATLSVLSSVLLYAACFFGAPGFSAAMGAPAATPVIRVLALNVVISGVVAVPSELLQRYFRQDRKMIADQVNNWLGAGVSVGLALAGFGAMSLGIGQLVGGLAAAVIYLVVSPLPVRFGFDRGKARELLGFGLPLAGSSALVFAVGNVDNLVVGHLLGATALGYYVLAWNLANWPVNMFSQPVRNVAPAMFSRLQHDPAAMRSGFLSVLGLLGSATLPVCLLISGAAAALIEFAYGARWLPAAQALVWLGALAAVRILFELMYDYFVVLARAGVVLAVEVVWLCSSIPALIAGARIGGIFGVGAADVAVAACVVLPWYLNELKKVGIRRRAVAARLWLPCAVAAGVGVVAAVAARTIPVTLAALAVGGVAAVAAVGLLIYRSRGEVASLRAQGTGGAPVTGEVPAAGPPVPAAAGAADAVARTAEAIRVLLSMATPVTGPLPLYRDTVAALQWDPVQTLRQSRVPRTGPGPRRRPPGWRAPSDPAERQTPAGGQGGPTQPTAPSDSGGTISRRHIV